MQRFAALASSDKFRPFLAEARSPWTYATDAETAKRLHCAGFTEVETGLESTPALLKNAEAFSEFIESVILRSHLPLLPDERLRQDLLKELTILASFDTPPFELDYWRLNLRATRPR